LSKFHKSEEETQISLKSDKNNSTLRENQYVGEFSEWQMFQTNLYKKIKTHFVVNTIFFFESRGLWDNVGK